VIDSSEIVQAREDTHLSAGDARLILEPDESDWCQVLLDLDGRRIALGADTIGVIVQRLRDALLDRLTGTASGVLNGIEVFGVLSLYERHSTLYAGDRGDRRLLFVQTEDGSLIGTLELGPDDMRRWQDQLGQVGGP
jgi:hypothetical protein